MSMFQEVLQRTPEEFFQKMEGSVEEMDTSDTQWGWFYLAECGKWHMFQVTTYELILVMISVCQTTYCLICLNVLFHLF